MSTRIFVDVGGLVDGSGLYKAPDEMGQSRTSRVRGEVGSARVRVASRGCSESAPVIA